MKFEIFSTLSFVTLGSERFNRGNTVIDNAMQIPMTMLEETNDDDYTKHDVGYSVCASFAMTVKNSSSRADWVVKSSLSRHILILPCESPVATV